MKKTHLLIALFICLCTQAQIANFPYQLDYWKPVGITIKNAFAVNTNEYMLIGSVENYSPETYPGLFTNNKTQQQWQGCYGYVRIQTDANFNVLNVSPILQTHVNLIFFKNTLNEVYFYYHNIFGKLNSNGSVAYTQQLNNINIETMAYHNGLLYGLRAQAQNVLTNVEIPGTLFVFNASNGTLLNEYLIADPAAAEVDYLGIAVDDSGIYVMGTATYMEVISGQPLNTTFYYTKGAFQPFQQISTNFNKRTRSCVCRFFN